MADKHPLTEALRTEIVKLATEGDTKKEGALSADVLLKIMRVAKTGRDLLVSIEASPSNLSSLVQRPRNSFLGSSLSSDDDMMGNPDGQGQAMYTAFSPSSPSENFGMTAIREIITAAKNFNGNGHTPARLVEAIAIAKEKGLDDVVQELEKQLGMPKKNGPKIEQKPVEQKEAS